MKKIFVVLATVLATQSVFAQMYFGRVRVNSMNMQTTYVTNNTNGEIRLTNAYASGMFFNVNHSCYGTLRPMQSCMVQVQYWPSMPGYHSAYITMNFSDTVSHMSYSKSINAWGEAVAY